VALFEKEMARYGETSRAWRLRLELADYLTVNDRDERAGELCATIWPEHRDKSIGRSAGLLLAQIRARQGRRDEAKEILEGILPFAGDDIARAAHMLLDGIVKHGKPAPPVGGKLLDGTTLEPSELERIPVVAVFWDPKIAISTHVMSRWSKLAEEGEGKRFRTVGFPVHSDKQAIRQAVEENGIAAPQIDTTPKTAETWRIRAVPWVHVIDAEGRWFSSGWPLNRLGGLPEPR